MTHHATTTLTLAAIILSDHVEDRARHVLRSGAPHLLAPFNDGLLRLTMHTRVERVSATGDAVLPAWAETTLSAEDRRVLLGALTGRADWLFSHDRDFFKGPIQGMKSESPATFTWDPLETANVRRGKEGFTFLGWFYPQWSSEAVAGTDEIFFIFEIADYIRSFYSARTGTFHVQWNTRSGVSGGLRLPMPVAASSYHFVAVICANDLVTLFVNDRTRRREIRLGPPPLTTTFHPFMSAQSEHQIFGGCQFRVADSPLDARTVRRHFLAHSVRLSDGELRFSEWVGRSSLLLSPLNGGIIEQST